VAQATADLAKLFSSNVTPLGFRFAPSPIKTAAFIRYAYPSFSFLIE
jgi:hypothetical protein